MAKLVQCVPNFSEGRRPDVVRRIADAVKKQDGVKLVDYSWDVDHNRSVITFVGAPDAVRTAMLAAARAAVQEIDLRKHFGGHPRIGAVDVVPVVPLTDCTMEDCISLSHEIGKDFGNELGIPVYLYGKSAATTHRASLPNVRKGGFERLVEAGELRDELAPDFGPARVHPTAGASAVGARGPLIAFNVNLDTADMEVALEIARKIRRIRETGEKLAGVRAIGVELKSRGIVQVSTNITEPQKTSMYDVYSFIQKEAEKLGVGVIESELIGAARLDDVIRSLSQCIGLDSLAKERILDTWIGDF